MAPKRLPNKPVPMATLYRGETGIIGPSAKPLPDWMLEDKDYLAANDAAGRWFSRTPEEAQWYIDHAAKMGKVTGMSSLEVPEADLIKYLVANQPKEVRSHSRRPDEEYFLPKDLAATRKRIIALLASITAAGGASQEAEAAPLRERLRAFHGSPHDFNKFDSRKIGTGEGSQAFGHGLYLAEDEGVARHYSNVITPDRRQIYDEAQADLLAQKGEAAFALQELEIGYKNALQNSYLSRRSKESIDEEFLGEIARARSNMNEAHSQAIAGPPRPQGHMYKVNIDVDPHTLIRGDVPFDWQQPEVKDALQELGYRRTHGRGDRTGLQSYFNVVRKAEPAFLGGAFQRDQGTVDRLAKDFVVDNLVNMGIPGIQFLDGRHRSRGYGTKNYVMFPGTEGSIKIIRKYAVPALVTAAAGGAAAQAQDPQALDSTLTPNQESHFQDWYADVAAKAGLSTNPDDPLHYYNWRSAYLAGATPDEQMHWPSQFKRAEHPNRFVDGEDTITGKPQSLASLESQGYRPPSEMQGNVGLADKLAQAWGGTGNEVAPKASGVLEQNLSRTTAALHQDAMVGVIRSRMVPWLKHEGAGEEDASHAFDAILSNRTTPAGQELANRFLDYMQSVSYRGEHAPDGSISQSEYGKWQAEDPLTARHRLSPDGAATFANQRDYDLLRSMQMGHHAPGYDTSFMSYGTAALGNFIDYTGDTAKLLAFRTTGGKEGRAQESLYWYDKSDPSRDAGGPQKYADGLFGSRYPDLSPLTGDGLNHTLSSSDNPMGVLGSASELAARGPFQTLFSDPVNTIRSAKTAIDQMTVNNNSGRPTQIMPDTASDRLGKEAAVANEAAMQHQAHSASAYAPQLKSYLGMKPAYMSQAGEIATHLPGDILLDATTAFGVGKSALMNAVAGPAGTARRVASMAKEIGEYPVTGAIKEMPWEGPQSVAIQNAFVPPADGMLAAFTPQPTNPNVTLPDASGVQQPVLADDPRYLEAYDAGMAAQEERLNKVRSASGAYRTSPSLWGEAPPIVQKAQSMRLPSTGNAAPRQYR